MNLNLHLLLAQTAMTTTDEVIPWIVGAVLALACFGVLWFARSRSSNIPDDAVDDASNGVFGDLTPVFARVLPDLLPYKARRDLLRCGLLQPHAYDSYRALRNALVIGITVSTGVWLVAVADDDSLVVRVLLGGCLAIVLAYSLPRLYLNWRGDQAAEQTVIGLPDALEATVMGLSGGLSVQTALQRTCQELVLVHPQLAAQLQIVRRQASAGTLEQALDRWAQRVELDEVAALAGMISHAEQMGANVAVALRNYADALRLQRLQRVQERSNRVAVQMLFPTVLCLAPATYIVLLAPPLLDLQRFREQENQSGGLLERPTKIGGPTSSQLTK